MKQAAPFTLRVGDATLSDFLRFNPSSESYRSTLVVPEGMQGPVALKDVELEDYAGNRQRYTFLITVTIDADRAKRGRERQNAKRQAAAGQERHSALVAGGVCSEPRTAWPRKCRSR